MQLREGGVFKIVMFVLFPYSYGTLFVRNANGRHSSSELFEPLGAGMQIDDSRKD